MEIFLYEEIDRYTAQYFNSQLGWADVDRDININVNSHGGEVPSGVAMLYKLQAFKNKGNGKVNMFVDGVADSMLAFMLIFADYSEANDMATMTFHRAAYPEDYIPDEDEVRELGRINLSCRQKMELRLQGKGDAAQKLITDIFESEKRLDITLSAQQAFEMGIIDKVVPLNPVVNAKKTQSFALQMKSQNRNINLNTNNKKKMDLAKLKSEHPEVYAQAFKEGENSGIIKGTEQEYQRTNTILAYREADEEGCLKMIKDKEIVTSSIQAELNIKMMKKQKLNALEQEGKEEGAGTPPTEPNNSGGAQMSEQDKAEIEMYRKKKFTL